MKVVTAAEMRAIEDAVVKRGTSLDTLMQRAGSAIARAVMETARDAAVLVLAGPGNNGGDGIIAATELSDERYSVVLYSYRRKRLEGYTGTVVTAESDSNLARLTTLVQQSSVIVDALLGIGQTRPPDDNLAAILRSVNTNRSVTATAIAVDIPTGVNADTGGVPGEAFRADITVAMGFPKCGNVVYPGAAYCGRLRLEDVGFPSELAGGIKLDVPEDTDVAQMLPRRPEDSNKGRSGRLLFVGGSRDYLGAPVLSSLAAYRAGAGLVEAAVPESIEHSVAAHLLEAIYRPVPEADGQISVDALASLKQALDQARAVVFGPGMGLSDGTVQFTAEFLKLLSETRTVCVLIDADALNALARLPKWWETDVPIILTPHPGEMARLTGLSISEIQSDRLSVARQFAASWDKIVVLKGAGTIVAAPSGEAIVNPTGGPNLATAGTGDVLSGTIGGLLAQGLEPFPAAVAGAYLHGRAGDLLRAEQGDVGTIAGDLTHTLPRARLSILERREESL